MTVTIAVLIAWGAGCFAVALTLMKAMHLGADK
jgi:hypothetical protein